MKKILLLLFALFLVVSVFGQNQRRRDMNRIPQGNNEPSEQEIAKREREIEERKDEYIGNFLTTLEADEFQKHIIKQSIKDYFEVKLVLLKRDYNHSIDREQAIKKLDDNYFLDLKNVISESDMSKIIELTKGEFDEKEIVKEKKKKKKKKKRKKDKSK